MFKKFDEILTDIQNLLRGSTLTDWNPGSVLRTLSEAWAALLEEAYFWLDWLLSQFFVGTAVGEWLDARVADFMMVRIQGDTAAGLFILGRDSPSPISVLIPEGTEFEKDGLKFATLTEVKFLEGESQIEVSVRAVDVGAAYNLLPNTELKQVGMAVAAIEWVRVKELRGGLDRESDEKLRNRVPEHFASLSRATRPSIEYALQSLSGVRVAAIKPNDPDKGWFTVYLDMIETPELNATIARTLEEWRGFTIHYRIAQATVRNEVVELALTVHEDYRPEEIKALVEQAMKSYFTSLGMGVPLLVASLYQVAMNTKGVANVRVISPAADVIPDESEFVRHSEVIFS
jgi:Uncharacterized homolog of phage Mu protein gp47